MLRNKLCIVTTDNPTFEERRFVIPKHNNFDKSYLCEVFTNLKSVCGNKPEKDWVRIQEDYLEVIITDAGTFFH
jgi:hypothetical protein